MTRFISKVNNYKKKHGGYLPASKAVLKAMRLHGVRTILYRSLKNEIENSYEMWIKEKETKYDLKQVTLDIEKMNNRPLISIVMPVYNVEEVYLRECIESILKQYYENFELCIADDASTNTDVKRVLTEFEARDSRIKVVYRKENGHISAASNSAIEIARGEYLAFIDNDDLLKPEALYEMVKEINQNPELDLIYSDEDKISANGEIRLDPFFKPDWSPDSFLGHMYMCHFIMYRRLLVNELGGLRLGYEGAQDYDLALRFIEKTNQIGHVAKILYHWRMIPSSTASDTGAKNYAFEASLKAKQDYLDRNNYNAIIEADYEKSITNIFYQPKKEDKVSIIIPTRNHGEDVKKCINSIYEKSTWRNFEIILVDNGSTEKESLDIFEFYKKQYGNFKILKLDIPFNYSKLNNEAATVASGDYLLFLNNDTEVITENWLERMVGQASLPYAGAIGAKLYYPDNTVQHAGVITMNGMPGHTFHGYMRGDYGYFARMLLNYNYLAVTAACMLVQKEKFFQVGGFDEQFVVAFNDVDLCLKLYTAGYHNVVMSTVELYHYESKSRGYEDTEEKRVRFQKETNLLQKKWPVLLWEDPYYNENFSRDSMNFDIF